MPNIDRELKIRLPKTYVKNIPVKFHPGPIWNDGASGFLKTVAQQQQQEQQDE